MYQKLQYLLPEFMIEPVTMDNLSIYETVFYSNEEYYYLTDGKPATRELDTLYVGLLIVDKRFKRKSIGTSIMKALFSVATDLKFKNLRLSVQENNIDGLNFWKKMGFYEIGRCTCKGFDNLSMKYDI